MPGNRVSMILAGKRAISGDIALRLAAVFRTTAEFRGDLQKGYALEVARDGFEAEIERDE